MLKPALCFDQLRRNAGQAGTGRLQAMSRITRQMAADVIEDAFTDLVSARGRGIALGVCGAFYLCGLISEKEWRRYLERIPAEPFEGALPAAAVPDAWCGGEAQPGHSPGC
jgi:hypothetical protein